MNAPANCQQSCMEVCKCNSGFVHSNGKCIPLDKCGCIYKGQQYSPDEVFWADDNCQERCRCNALTKDVTCKSEPCSTECSVVKGIRDCQPLNYSTCYVSGDPHFVTFDGRRYDFQGTCQYTLAALTYKNSGLPDFQVLLQSDHLGNQLIAKAKSVTAKVYGVEITISRDFPDTVEFNGLLTKLPFNYDQGRVTVYKRITDLVIQTDFQLTVTFSSGNRAAVTLPASYAGAVHGLCGNFNGNPDDDFEKTETPSVFGELWLVHNTPGCVGDQAPVCKDFALFEKEHREGEGKCGLILDKKGPFRDCHHLYNPEGYFMDCVSDACFNKGRLIVIQQALTSYAATCQDAGVTLYPWRTGYLALQCSANSHYELCAEGCQTTCAGLRPPTGCNAQCREGCVCDDGFILSGDECVPVSQCGCVYRGVYYKPGEIFHPTEACKVQCMCRSGGIVDCTPYSCRANEECRIEYGIRKCFSKGLDACFVSGGSHYYTFDGFSYDFQGTCTYTLVKSTADDKMITPFMVTVQNAKTDQDPIAQTKTLEVVIYGTTLTMSKDQPAVIKVDGEIFNLPIKRNGGKIQAYQHGNGVIVVTNFGLQVIYDFVYHITVILPSSYKDRVEGLCGNYNGNNTDDYQLHNGRLLKDSVALGKYWKIAKEEENCIDECKEKCEEPTKGKLETYEGDRYCGVLKMVNGPFRDCYSIINPEPYFNNCVFDVAISNGAMASVCAGIQSYVADCQTAGVIVQPWRNDSFCSFSCPANSVYKMCAKVCKSSCFGLTDRLGCPKTCVEGCDCLDGFLCDGIQCVPLENCGCYHKGIYFKPNQKLVTSQCQETCTCDPIKGVSCEPLKCGANEECEVKNGVLGCYVDPCRRFKCRAKESCQVKQGKAVCVPKYTGMCRGNGDPHYTTFDGYKFDLQGTCTYVLASYTGNETGLQPFSITEKNENRGNKVFSYVREVDMDVYGHRISVIKGEKPKIRVDGVSVNLPVTLEGGKIKLSLNFRTALLVTDFGLRASFDWNWRVIVIVPSSYHGLTSGLCGNFNKNENDDMITSDNKHASSILEWAQSWRVNPQEPFCADSCTGDCPSCDEAKKNQYTARNSCGIITDVNGPFKKCLSVIDARNPFSSCVYDVCMNEGAKALLCQAIDAFAAVCQDKGFEVGNWREVTSCTMKCPENSHYEACGNACPASCTDRTAPDNCTEPCMETCQCDKDYVLSSDKCVHSTSCGCDHNGFYYQPNDEFWSDESCSSYCICDPKSNKVVCSNKKCKSSEQCKTVNGKRGCYPSSFATCVASGDPHYYTFDKKKFDFMGTCIYQLVKVNSSDPTLTPFSVTIRNENRGDKTVSFTRLVNFEVYNLTITISKEFPRKIQVNGVLTQLPFYYDNGKITAFIKGLHGFIKTDFDVTVTFNWKSYARVILPASYANAVSGLCGNSNDDPMDDFIMSNGMVATSATQFGKSWKVGEVPGCADGCEGNCPVCKEQNKEKFKSEQYCGIITKPNGPFINCHTTIDPTPYFEDCVFDTCYFEGQSFAFTSIISNYVSACQAAGIVIHEWRTTSFAKLECPPHSHYELCGTGCAPTCYDLSSPRTCEPSCTEGCYCNSGFIQSGDGCVPISECGCLHKGNYYEKGQKLFIDDSCTEWCECRNNGLFVCQNLPCSPTEQCSVVNGFRQCVSDRCSKCTVAGAHYITFDGQAYDFQGTCSYTLVKVVANNPRLVIFSVMVENEINAAQLTIQKRVIVSVYGKEFSFNRKTEWKVTVGDEILNLPLNYPDGTVWINQEGTNIILQTDFGLKVLYDTQYRIVVQVTGNYWSNINGLCGNYNDDLTDELMLPNEKVTKSVETFGAAWKVPVAGVACSDSCGEACPVADPKKIEESSKVTMCGLLKSTSGPFKGCFSKVNPMQYFKNCIYDMSIAGDQSTLCRHLHAYVSVCQAAGGEIKSWRTDTFCPLSCGKHSGEYNLCMRTCDQTCAQVTVPYSCTMRCFEGCSCPNGEYFDGKQCVPMEKCGCVYKGQYMQVEEYIVSSNCTNKCTCKTGGLLSCENYGCHEKEFCSIRNGQRSCFGGEGQCSVSPKSIITTFDDFDTPVSVTGPYEVASLCDKSSPNWFRIVHIPGQSSKDQSVYVFFKKTYVSSNTEKKAMVDGSPVELPALAPSEISVHSSEEGVSIEQSAGVKVFVGTSGDMTIKVPVSLSSRMCGPCGNFNGNSADDETTNMNEKGSKNIEEIIKDWKAEV
ncbi:IgGFc-binding protein-like [Bombina bombina]|uniref:IgGFc-binding protein-like n=1 Tax=Bombina bombina TaxID=8345 RepID=UPI00235AB0F3|nr:IgGFc-binding protein-like [Bombina bombina]